jgi:alcohol dehydrogenase
MMATLSCGWMRPRSAAPTCTSSRATCLKDTSSTPTLMRLVTSGQIDAKRFITHRLGLDEFEAAYDVFARAADTGALKVVLSR